MIVHTGTTFIVSSSASVFLATDVGSELWQAYDASGLNVGGRAKIVSFVNSKYIRATALTDFDMGATNTPGNWFLTTGIVYGLLNFVGEKYSTQVDGSPGGIKTIGTDGSIKLSEPASVVQAGYGYRGLLASQNIDAGGKLGTAQGKIRKVREIVARFLNAVACRIGTSLWDTVGLVFMEQDDLTDMPVPLYSDVLRIRPDDSWQRKTKQVIVMQDQPAPQTLLSLDVQVECSDD